MNFSIRLIKRMKERKKKKEERIEGGKEETRKDNSTNTDKSIYILPKFINKVNRKYIYDSISF